MVFCKYQAVKIINMNRYFVVGGNPLKSASTKEISGLVSVCQFLNFELVKILLLAVR